MFLLGCGLFSLALVAYVLDEHRAGNWFIAVQLLVMGLVGALVTLALPALARRGAAAPVRAATGIAWGILASLAGVLVIVLALGGLR